MDTNARCFFSFYYCTQWFALRLDVITTLMTGSTAFLVVILRGSVDSSLAALALLYVMSLAGDVCLPNSFDPVYLSLCPLFQARWV